MAAFMVSMIFKLNRILKPSKTLCQIGVLAVLIGFATGPLRAQSALSVKAFKELANDLDARVNHPKTDANGEPAALIKMITTQRGFAFEGGMVGIVSTEEQVGEIWIYIPASLQRLTIKHPQLGVLRDYAFPINIKPATVYEMELISGTVEVVVKPKMPLTQWMVILSEPEQAMVYLNDELMGSTPFQRKLPEGLYQYRIEHPLYHPALGQVEIKQQKAELNLSLKPKYGKLVLNMPVQEVFEVYVDDQATPKNTPLNMDKLSSGTHRLRLLNPWYVPLELEVVIKDGETTTLNPKPEPLFGTLKIQTLEAAEIWVDGERKGVGKAEVRVLKGLHTIKLTHEAHETHEAQIEVKAGIETLVNQTLIPITGQIEVVSTPIGAKVYLNNRLMGQCPLTLNQLLIGPYTLRLEMPDYAPVERQLILKANESLEVIEKLEKVTVKADKVLDFKMVFVEGGIFRMGCTPEQGIECGPGEKPVHQVRIDDYYIGAFEVTQAQWMAVMGSNPSYHKNCDQCPVEQVSWRDVQEFLEKLNALTGKNYRLPTEAEWEYAARGGNRSKGYKYSGSHNIEEVAWYGDNSGDRTHAVGQKKANELGLYDMSGNVWEWCSDWYGEYSSSSQTNPQGPSGDSYRVFRGGSWHFTASGCRVADRSNLTPDYRSHNIGFRVAFSQ